MEKSVIGYLQLVEISTDSGDWAYRNRMKGRLHVYGDMKSAFGKDDPDYTGEFEQVAIVESEDGQVYEVTMDKLRLLYSSKEDNMSEIDLENLRPVEFVPRPSEYGLNSSYMGRFHGWAAKPLPADGFRYAADVYAIVEGEDGQVFEIEPKWVRFLDREDKPTIIKPPIMPDSL